MSCGSAARWVGGWVCRLEEQGYESQLGVGATNRRHTEETIWSVPFVILMASNFFQSLAAFTANTTLPLYIDLMGASAGMVGVIIGAFAITALLVRPFAGPAFDSFSRKRILLAAQGIIALAFFLYSFARTPWTLFAVRLLHGLGIGCAGPVAMSLVSEYLPMSKFASGVSIYMLSQSFAQVIGPAAGLWMADAFGFQVTYRIAACMLLFSVLAITRVREAPRERPPYQFRLDRMFALEAVDKAVVLALFAAAFACVGSYLVLYAKRLGIDDVGSYFVVYAICLLGTRPLFGRMADNFGAERVLLAGVACFAASYVVLSQAATLPGFLVAAVIGAAGFGSCVPLVQTLAMASVDAERRGAASNTSFTGMDLGFLVGPAVAGAVIELLDMATGSILEAYSLVWLVMLVPLACAFAIILRWNLRRGGGQRQR